MGNVIITLKVLPDSPERNLEKLSNLIEEKIKRFGKLYKKSIQPIAFGINAIVYSIIIEEKIGTEPIENEIRNVEGVSDIQITDVTRVVDNGFI